MNHPKVQLNHVQRQAVIYVRQSSPQAVEQHLESQKRQYQLVERAQALGWPAAQCVVIDDDLGISGAQSHNRPGYQHLIAQIALREVGIVLGLEVSRLARNSLDWYQLLELAAAFDVLIADEDGVYDPGDFNDRLLLGLKGTISEVELYQIRARMVRGKLNKAQRGELAFPLAVGLDWDPVTQRARLAVDQAVQHTIARVFTLFRQWRSIRGVLRALREEGRELPYQRLSHELGRQIAWRQPSYDALYLILTNPAYAGVYCYGKRARQVDPLTHTLHVHKCAREEWEVFLPEHYPGYITLAEFEENQRVLADNRAQYPMHSGAARHGPTLLQGLVYCKHCGRKMRVCYSGGGVYYICDTAQRRFGEPVCNRASSVRVDELVGSLFLRVVNTANLELSLDYAQRLQHEQQAVAQGWREKLQRLTYAADLARRRYELVDPANRLVAQTLETEWNQRLAELAAAQQAYVAQTSTATTLQSTVAELQAVIAHLPEYWHSAALTCQDQKELLRCLIDSVFLENAGKLIRAEIHWQGGACSALEIPKYLFSSAALYQRVSELAHTYTDAEIAARLNQEHTLTFKGKLWTARRVMDFRRSNAIPSGFTTQTELRLPDSGYVTSLEAAKQLAVDQTTIQHWYQWGVLTGKQNDAQSPLWIHWTPEVVYRLNGGATPDPRMVSVRSLCRARGQSPEQVLAWASADGHTIYRLRRGTAMRFYVLPQESSVPLE